MATSYRNPYMFSANNMLQLEPCLFRYLFKNFSMINKNVENILTAVEVCL